MAEYYSVYRVQEEQNMIPADYARYIAWLVERDLADTIFEQLESGEKILTLDPCVTKFMPETMTTQWEQKLTVQDLVRCKDCKYARLTFDGSCKYCDIWFPDEAEYMDGDYYCASAERRTDG